MLLTAGPKPNLCSPRKSPGPICVSPPKSSVNSTVISSLSIHPRLLHSQPARGCCPGLSVVPGAVPVTTVPQPPHPICRAHLIYPKVFPAQAGWQLCEVWGERELRHWLDSPLVLPQTSCCSATGKEKGEHEGGEAEKKKKNNIGKIFFSLY